MAKKIDTKKDLIWLINRIVVYCETQAGIKFYPYQKEFAERIVKSLVLNEGEELSVLISRQGGKTEGLAVTIGGLMVILPRLAKMEEFNELLKDFREGIWIGLFAPSREQAFTTFSRARHRIKSKNAEMILTDPDIDTKIDREGNPLVLDNGSFLRMHSAAKQSRIESKTYHLIIIEEAQDVDRRKILKSIHPMGAAVNGTIVKVGTSNNQRCEFLEVIERNRARNMKGKTKVHFEYDDKTVKKYNPKYAKFLKKEKRRLGEDSDEFRMSYRLEWLLERGMFLSKQMWEDLENISLKHKNTSKKECVAGIDCGKKNNSTVVTIGEIDMEEAEVDEFTQEVKPPKEVISWLELHGDDYEIQYHEILDYFKGFPNLRVVFIDNTGVGTPIVDRIKAGLMGRDITIVGYDFSIPSKSVMWKNLQTEIRAGRLTVASHAKTRRLRSWKRFKRQIFDLEKDYKQQYMVCHKPKDVKDALDDYCDSLGLMCLAAHETAMPEIEVYDDNFLIGGSG